MSTVKYVISAAALACVTAASAQVLVHELKPQRMTLAETATVVVPSNVLVSVVGSPTDLRLGDGIKAGGYRVGNVDANGTLAVASNLVVGTGIVSDSMRLRGGLDGGGLAFYESQNDTFQTIGLGDEGDFWRFQIGVGVDSAFTGPYVPLWSRNRVAAYYNENFTRTNELFPMWMGGIRGDGIVSSNGTLAVESNLVVGTGIVNDSAISSWNAAALCFVPNAPGLAKLREIWDLQGTVFVAEVNTNEVIVNVPLVNGEQAVMIKGARYYATATNYFLRPDGGTNTVSFDETGNMIVAADGTAAMTISTNGKVGIGLLESATVLNLTTGLTFTATTVEGHTNMIAAMGRSQHLRLMAGDGTYPAAGGDLLLTPGSSGAVDSKVIVTRGRFEADDIKTEKIYFTAGGPPVFSSWLESDGTNLFFISTVPPGFTNALTANTP